MSFRRLILGLLWVTVLAIDLAAQNCPEPPTTIRAARVLDGRGGVIENGVIELLAYPVHPHEIVIELSLPCGIKGFTYLPRQDE